MAQPRLLLQLTEEQREIQRVAREFARDEIAPHSAQWDRERHFERSLVAKMGELGFLGMLIPPEYDGLGLDTGTYLVALEEIATVDAAVAILMGVHNSLPTQMILKWGSEAQKRRFLAPMARGELLGAFALSEPEAGSDAASLRTQAVREGDEWVITGTKSWVSHGNEADVI
ncbi:MAG TPA: acyl-CoA dehydrogenase family protein, partial [Gemmatimonadaceae bacterium]